MYLASKVNNIVRPGKRQLDLLDHPLNKMFQLTKNFLMAFVVQMGSCRGNVLSYTDFFSMDNKPFHVASQKKLFCHAQKFYLVKITKVEFFSMSKKNF